jgi:hypothetical protein
MMVESHGDRAGVGDFEQVCSDFTLAEFQKERGHDNGDIGAIGGGVLRVANRLFDAQAGNTGIDNGRLGHGFAGGDGERAAVIFIKQVVFGI